MGGAAAEVDRSVQRKTKTKTVCLLRGNCHRYAMVLTGKDGAVENGENGDSDVRITKRDSLAARRPCSAVDVSSYHVVRAEREYIVPCAYRWLGDGAKYLRQCSSKTSRGTEPTYQAVSRTTYHNRA